MQETRRNLMVGLFVLVGLGALGALVILFGHAPGTLAGATGTPLHIHFPSAAGIRSGNMVTIGGLPVGRVLGVDFIDPKKFSAGVDAIVVIQSEYQIPDGSRAVTTEPGLGAGRPPIEIIPGPPGGKPLAANAVIQGTVMSAVAQFIPENVVNTLDKTTAQIGEAAAALTPVLNDMHELLLKRTPADVDRPGGPQGNLFSAIARLDTSFKNLNTVIGDPAVQSQVKDSIANIKDSTEGLKAAVADVRTAAKQAPELVDQWTNLAKTTQVAVEHADGQIADVGRRAGQTLDTLSKVGDNLYQITDSINRGEGTFGALLRNGKLYDALTLTVERLGKAFEEFEGLVKEWRTGKSPIRVAL